MDKESEAARRDKIMKTNDKLDYFAAHALQGILANGYHRIHHMGGFCEEAFAAARDMMEISARQSKYCQLMNERKGSGND